jgi:hypothetical protein
MFEISNAPGAQTFPQLKYKYVMNEPFIGGSSATTQWSHDQLQYKRMKMMEQGHKLGVPQEPVRKTEDQVKKEREDLW